MTQEEIKLNFSENLISLRKAHNLTQLQLAEKLNYSDKAVSKWEVGAVLPDIETISRIAEFFGLTVNDLIYKKKEKLTKMLFKNHVFITLLSFGLVWFFASILYFILEEATTIVRPWLTFIVAIPISFIVLTVFTTMWFKKTEQILSISGLFWGLLTAVYLCIFRLDLWFIFIIGVVGQVLIILWGLYTGQKKK
ncbi:MAG: helix-turn-helix transcriptional regulator [Clostridiales bacterium]|nr:helix-turn-helix transcriptional regulator [Clostridiales bacterium]